MADSSVVGFIGVIGGALSTGGVQLILGWRARRTDAIASARIAAAALYDVQAIVSAGKEMGNWPPTVDNMQRDSDIWATHQTVLARSLDWGDFLILEAAFIATASLVAARASPMYHDEADGGVRLMLGDPRHGMRMQAIAAGITVARRAGQRGRDRLRRGKLSRHADALLDEVLNAGTGGP